MRLCGYCTRRKGKAGKCCPSSGTRNHLLQHALSVHENERDTSSAGQEAFLCTQATSRQPRKQGDPSCEDALKSRYISQEAVSSSLCKTWVYQGGTHCRTLRLPFQGMHNGSNEQTPFSMLVRSAQQRRSRTSQEKSFCPCQADASIRFSKASMRSSTAFSLCCNCNKS